MFIKCFVKDYFNNAKTASCCFLLDAVQCSMQRSGGVIITLHSFGVSHWGEARGAALAASVNTP